MKVFDVSINGRRICRAGVGADGVLSAIVTWAKLTGPAAAEARRIGQPLEDLFLQVGGLKDNSHRRWSYRHLRVGDRVTVEVGEARRFDPPVHEKRIDPVQDEQRERKYYLRLKRKFEGQRKTSARTRPSRQDAETTFLNVDLDIWSRSPLDSLVRAATFLRDRDDVRIVVAGFGARHTEMVRLARRLEVEETVRFFPYQKRSRLPLSLSSADVHVVGLAKGLSGYVVPSRVYGILAAGRPVVVLLPPGNVKVRAFVPETRIGAVQPGGTVRVSVDGREPVVGTVSFISPQAEYTPPVIYSQETRSKLVFMIEAVFDRDTSMTLNPGQPVDVYVGTNHAQ